ncbi:MAG: ABC transporter ATP-binding protein [Proteobacteria bacterium]|nr:ABC transporter ATP-binding protein [Pseudomonadota bacterium]
MAEPVIRFQGVSKSFGSKVVLQDLSLDIPRGQTTVILGPSGTGKSVLIKLLVGLLEPDEGSILVEGVDVATATEAELFEVRKQIGMLFQDGALFDSLSVADNIAFPLRRHTTLSDEAIAAKVAELLAKVGLEGIEELMPSSLSGGMRKRVSLARAIVMDPEIVLFDEPNSGLDPVTSDEIDALIGRMKDELGMTFIIISHDIVGTFAVADKIAMLYNGGLIADGTPDEVLHSREDVVRRFLKRNMELPPL